MALAGASMAIVLALLTFEQTQAIRFAICSFAVIPNSSVTRRHPPVKPSPKF